jgi:hypothetical protein
MCVQKFKQFSGAGCWRFNSEKRTIFNEAFDSKADLELLEGVENLIKELHQKVCN